LTYLQKLNTQKPKNKLKTKGFQAIPMPFQDEEKKEFRSDFHSLFIEDKAEEHIPLDDENGNILDGIYGIEPAYKVYKFYVGDFAEEGTDLHPILNKFHEVEDNDYLEFHIDSNGGSVNEGKLFFDLINNFHPDNVAAFLNVGYSMGALLFCMPDIRIVHEFSDLMFHDYSTFMYGKAGDLETSHNHSKSHIRNFFKQFTVDKGFLTQDEFELMLVGKEFWMDTKEMIERGIATHVKTVKGVISAEKYMEEKFPKPKEKKPRKGSSKAPKKLKELMQLEDIPEAIEQED